ncbi:MAG: MBL fold metallo-hydrolase [Deinococcus sp.]|nr:MBL fold metallo-hydrolase [Deinococcus sp.]
MAVQVTFLGTGDAFASGGRLQTCYLAQSRTANFLLDCGPCSLYALKQAKVDPAGLDLVLISHLHGDHFGGLPFLLLDFQFASQRQKPVVVAGPPGTAQQVEQLLHTLYPDQTPEQRRFALRYVEVRPEQPVQLCGVDILPFEVVHQPGMLCLGYLVRVERKGILFSGDTQWIPRLGELSAQADLFICECTYYRDALYYHMNYAELQCRRSEIKSRRTVLTHLGPEVVAHLDELEFECASDGQQVTL